MNVKFRPLRWTGPGTPEDQRRSRHSFKAKWGDTLNLLDRELDYLDAEDVVMEADFTESDIRLDGIPRANARQPVHPGVCVAFESKFGPLIYSTDSCAFWQHNVRSIALGLEALRAVDRYGVTRTGEQYTGWKAIGAKPTPMPGKAEMTSEEAARFITEASGFHPGTWGALLDSIRSGQPELAYGPAYRMAARRLHPDRGGRIADFQRLQDAKQVLDGGTA